MAKDSHRVRQDKVNEASHNRQLKVTREESSSDETSTQELVSTLQAVQLSRTTSSHPKKKGTNPGDKTTSQSQKPVKGQQSSKASRQKNESKAANPQQKSSGGPTRVKKQQVNPGHSNKEKNQAPHCISHQKEQRKQPTDPIGSYQLPPPLTASAGPLLWDHHLSAYSAITIPHPLDESRPPAPYVVLPHPAYTMHSPPPQIVYIPVPYYVTPSVTPDITKVEGNKPKKAGRRGNQPPGGKGRREHNK